MTAARHCAIFSVILLSACTFGVPVGERQQGASHAPPTSGRSNQGNPSSYVVHGKRYFVLNSSQGFVQRGIASWYGIKFHGRKTSSGEIYNMHDMTAAHKTLPIPVNVHVRNLDNGRTAIVRVNDRGPFIDGRIIDLSYAAAVKLGVKVPGTANVEIRVIEKGQSRPSSVVRAVPLATPETEEPPLYIQMGSFSSLDNADNLVRELADANESSALVTPLKTDNGLFYRVRVGPLFDIEEANAILARLKGKGFETLRIVVDD